MLVDADKERSLKERAAQKEAAGGSFSKCSMCGKKVTLCVGCYLPLRYTELLLLLLLATARGTTLYREGVRILASAGRNQPLTILLTPATPA